MITKITNPVITNNTAETKHQQGDKSFKGAPVAILSGLRALNNSPAIGACAVDLCSMVIPRTVIETKNRGKQSGIETFFREVTSCVIHACVGLIGLGAATLISGKFNKNYNVKAQNIFASGDTINNMSKLWQAAEGKPKEYFKDFLGHIKGLNGTQWVSVSENTKDTIAEGFVLLSDTMQAAAYSKGKDKAVLLKKAKQLKSALLTKITQDTGAQASFKMAPAKEGLKGVSSSLSELVDNAVSLSNSFKGKPINKISSFAKALSKNKLASTALGLAICATLCMSVQPFNRWMTKKRTGQDGFVGVDDKQSNNSQGFKKAKTIAGIAFPALAVRSIGKIKDLPSNVQFNSKIPTLNQFKLLYGLTIASRFMSARDGNELRESVIKDTLGFTNWLILGGMVSKLTARALGGKELINNPVVQNDAKKGIKYAFKWLTKASVKSFDEVLLPNAKELVKDNRLMKFSELFKNAAPKVKKQVLKIAGSQVAGYLYSGLVLGVGISKLNIFITKKCHEKEKANRNMNKNLTDNPLSKIDLTYITKMANKQNSVFKDFN